MENKKVTIELKESDLKFLIYALRKAELWFGTLTNDIHMVTEDPDHKTTNKEFRQWQGDKIDKCFMLACDLESEHEERNKIQKGITNE